MFRLVLVFIMVLGFMAGGGNTNAGTLTLPTPEELGPCAKKLFSEGIPAFYRLRYPNLDDFPNELANKIESCGVFDPEGAYHGLDFINLSVLQPNNVERQAWLCRCGLRHHNDLICASVLNNDELGAIYIEPIKGNGKSMEGENLFPGQGPDFVQQFRISASRITEEECEEIRGDGDRR